MEVQANLKSIVILDCAQDAMYKKVSAAFVLPPVLMYMCSINVRYYECTHVSFFLYSVSFIIDESLLILLYTGKLMFCVSFF